MRAKNGFTLIFACFLPVASISALEPDQLPPERRPPVTVKPPQASLEERPPVREQTEREKKQLEEEERPPVRKLK